MAPQTGTGEKADNKTLLQLSLRTQGCPSPHILNNRRQDSTGAQDPCKSACTYVCTAS